MYVKVHAWSIVIYIDCQHAAEMIKIKLSIKPVSSLCFIHSSGLHLHSSYSSGKCPALKVFQSVGHKLVPPKC